jgi:HAD superfamily hydrolase (TIGR01484 family)
MARPYANEMENLLDTITWVNGLDLFSLHKTIEDSSSLSMLAVGSGGSLSAAVALASIHQYWTGQLAVAATALQAAAVPIQSEHISWLLSASGNNVDIMSAFNSIVEREPLKLGIICSNSKSKLAHAAQKHKFTDSHIYKIPAGKDGFLATNSLLSYVAIFSRAYATIFDSEQRWDKICKEVVDALSSQKNISNWKDASLPLLSRDNLIVLYDVNTHAGAFDIESKFTEAALGYVQLADTRNFAHGRHHWLAKRGKTSAVLSLTAKTGQRLAERTLNLIPKEIPNVNITLSDDPHAALIISILFSLHITQWAGEKVNIDPGRPGVPDFGRKIYGLPLSKNRYNKNIDALSLLDKRSIIRKSHEQIPKLREKGDLAYWIDALKSFKNLLSTTSFQAVVLDYDGTLVDTRLRFSPPSAEIANRLESILKSNIKVGFATGRGKSIRESLQSILPQTVWRNVFIAYYNGASIGTLDDNILPHHGDPTGILKKVAYQINDTHLIKSNSEITIKKNQISLSARDSRLTPFIWAAINEMIWTSFKGKIKAICSAHSIDIVPSDVSKCSLLHHMKKISTVENILVIGDQGQWPGNDHELLSEAFALSVDTVNSRPETCWNMGPAGQRGVETTLHYLNSLQLHDGFFAYSCED